MNFAELTGKIQKIPQKTRAIGFFVFLGLLVVLFIWQVHIPKNTQIKDLEKVVAGLNAEIQKNEEKIRKLDELKAEVVSLRERLRLLTAQLPPETEVSGLLRQIQELVTRSGLTLRYWRPEKKRAHSSGLYNEIPMTMELSGGYHNLAMFFDRVSKMTRIVNMMNVRMGSAKLVGTGSVEIAVNCTGMTFSAVEKKDEPAPAGKKPQ